MTDDARHIVCPNCGAVNRVPAREERLRRQMRQMP